MRRHRHQEFIRFVNALARDIPVGKVIHVILEKYAVNKQAKVLARLELHPRKTFHFTPTSVSRLNAVEGLFLADLPRRRLKNGMFRSVVDLQTAINRFLAERKRNPRPFIWRVDHDAIIAARNRGLRTLG